VGRATLAKGTLMTSAAEGAKRILLVDDNDELRDVCRRALERIGHRVACAGNGAEGIALFRSGGPFDVVITDVLMPEMDGIEFVKALRAPEQDQPVKIVAVSGGGRHFSADFGLRLCRAFGINGFLFKPFTPAELREAVDQL
jgi:CheY-like chemotaxis protein